MQTKSTEDYLKIIYGLAEGGDTVMTSAIAEELRVSSPSVSDMIKKLYEGDYISYTPYYGVRLTKKGERVALKIIRRHRLLEVFLMKYLNFPWELVHDEAERLEHVISDEFEDRLDQLLGSPAYDPHGAPIPTKDGVVEKMEVLRMSDLEAGETVCITKVTDIRSLLEFMKRIGLRLNHRVSISSKEEFDGSMKIRAGKKEYFISHEVARNIFVKKAEKQ